MAFTGDLQHLPIVDVIQLLHSTRKSGILRVTSRKGESQLVFKDGYIVSASHLNNSIRIGQILIDLKIITQETLDMALQLQQKAGKDRKPLVVTLVSEGLVKEADAYRGLEYLIEMTVVEILTWKKGQFTLDMLNTSVADEYKYYPGKMNEEINVDTQTVLMDALRIYDEKMRDGELQNEDLTDDDQPEESENISEDLLGLSDLDEIEAVIPKRFKVLEADPQQPGRQKLEEILPGVSTDDREILLSFLAKIPAGSQPSSDVDNPVAVIFSNDLFMIHAITTVCHPLGITVVATADPEKVFSTIATARQPLLILDGEGGAAHAAVLRGVQNSPCHVPVVHLCRTDHSETLTAYSEGADAVIPRPVERNSETFASEAVRFLEVFPNFLKRQAEAAPGQRVAGLRRSVLALRECREVPEVALTLLNYAAKMFERSLTLVVRDQELVAEKGIGLAGSGREPAQSSGFRIPVAESPLVAAAIDSGVLFYGQTADPLLTKHLAAAIGAPSSPIVLLLAVRAGGKTVSLTYADFGTGTPGFVDTDALDVLRAHAELVLENVLYRKRSVKPGQ